MRELFFIVTYLLIILLPFAAFGWIVYRMIKGSGGSNNSITGG